MTSTVTLHLGDVRDTLDRLAADGQTFDFAVTSPPFLALRSYLPADHPDKHREIGSEPTPAAFLDTCYGWTRQLGALLPEWASIAVELGDTMAGSGGAGGDYNPDGLRDGQPTFKATRPVKASPDKQSHRDMGEGTVAITGGSGWPLAKSMCLIPHLYPIGLAYGHNPVTGQQHDAGQWRIRNVITWARPNPPVGSLGKRNPTKRTGDYKFRPACSYITVACRGTGRYFDLDAVRTEHKFDPARYTGNGYSKGNPEGIVGNESMPGNPAGAPPLDWHTDQLDGDWLWKLATAPYKGSHYATYPLTLPRRLILAMCPQRVCEVCGWPSERISAVTGMVDGNGREVPRSTWASGMLNGQGAHTNKPNSGTTTTTTVGWTDCGHAAYRNGRTIDIFGGSGTTAVAAALEHRDAVLCDIDQRNADLIRRRLTETLRVLDETRTGDTIVWTVQPATSGELAAIDAGQLDLFGEPA